MNQSFDQSINEAITFSGVQGDEEPWRYCVSDTDSVIGYALGALFVKEAFHGGSKEKVCNAISWHKRILNQIYRLNCSE